MFDDSIVADDPGQQVQGVEAVSEPTQVSDGTGIVAEPTQEPVVEAPATVTPSTDPATVTRLQQQIAKQNSLLISLGIDPESDIADRFRAGVIDKTQLLGYIGVQPQTTQVSQQTTTPNPYEKLMQLREKGRKGEASQEDFADALDVIANIAQGYEQQTQNVQMETLTNQCKSATLQVLGSDNTHKSLPADIQAIEQEIFLLSTDHNLGTDAKGDKRFFTPRAYDYYAKKNMEQLNRLRNHYIELGKQMQSKAIAGTGQKTTVNPISAASGAAPMSTPAGKVTSQNWKQAAKAYIQRQGQV